MNKASLKKYVEKRLKESPYKLEAKSLSEYLGTALTDGNYKDALARTILDSYSSSGELLNEAMKPGGRRSDGYGERLVDILKARTEESLDRITKAKEKRDINALHGYLDYVSKLESTQTDLKQRAVNKLLDVKLYSREALRSYAMGMGLIDSDAKEISDSVYKSKVEKIEKEILSAVDKLTSTPDDAERVAREYGLDEDDVIRIKNSAEKLYEKYAPATDETLGELESAASKKGAIARLIEKIKGNKKGKTQK